MRLSRPQVALVGPSFHGFMAFIQLTVGAMRLGEQVHMPGCQLSSAVQARGGGGGHFRIEVRGTCRWTGCDFAVINISTRYLEALLRSSILAHGILWPSCGHQYWHRVSNRPNRLLAGYSVYHRVACQGFPAHNVYDRPAIWAPATRRCNIATGYAYENFQ